MSVGKVERKLIYKIKKFFRQLRTLRKKWSAFGSCFSNKIVKSPFYGLLSKLFQLGFQNCIIRVHNNIFRTKIFPQKTVSLFIIFGHWSNCSPVSGNFFSAGLSKLHATRLQEMIDWKCILRWINFIQQLRTSRENLSAFGRSFSDKIVKPTIYVLIGRFRGKHFLHFSKPFHDKGWKYFNFPSFFFSGVVNTAIDISRRTGLRKKTNQKLHFCCHFGQLANFSGFLADFFSTGSSKQHATCLQRIFER